MISGYQNWYSQPESFILTCQYCGTTTRVKDDFSCPACGAPYDMAFAKKMPTHTLVSNYTEAMQMAQCDPPLMSKKEIRRRWLDI